MAPGFAIKTAGRSTRRGGGGEQRACLGAVIGDKVDFRFGFERLAGTNTKRGPGSAADNADQLLQTRRVAREMAAEGLESEDDQGIARQDGDRLAEGSVNRRAAAAGGEAEAFFNLGAAHANGAGTRRNYAEALGWLIVARERGVHADAESRLREQIREYPKWIETGERRAREIKAEFRERAVTDFLPPAAPLDRVFDPLRPPAAKAP